MSDSASRRLAALARQLNVHPRNYTGHGRASAGGVSGGEMKALVKVGDTVSVQHVPIPTATGKDVVVRMVAAALNPTDLARMGLHGEVQGRMAAADGKGIKGGFFGGKGQQGVFGGEGAGVVVEVGPDADQTLLGKRVAAWSLMTQGSYAEYYKVPGDWTVELPPNVSFQQAAGPMINPMTALAMVDIAKAGGHKCMIHTAAASQLGQMLVRLCKIEQLELINVVRKPEQVKILREQGAQHVLNINDAAFRKEFASLTQTTQATIAFDAVGGDCTTALMLGMPVGSRVLIYGSLAGGDVKVPKAGQLLGMTPGTSVEGWNYGAWMIASGPAKRYATQQRAASMLGDVLATRFGRTCSLEELVKPDALEYYSKLSTNSKVAVMLRAE
eukprot:TRINITY_DN18461_c0_g1_i1.p1 TRINITY_DN18461_c0_g1~~TRINITY_DN18461_c0_g1_i1.p1  ORF type:complete len:386 (+),score=89.16 TRINITY_DN18461_c0_g1_i1:62-1219(+)